MDKSKKERISELLDMIETDNTKRSEFVKWFHPRMSWYIDVGFEYSDSQLNEIITFLEKLIYNGDTANN
jgi:hypothetical protein